MNLPFTLQQDPATKRYILRFNASLYKESNCLRKVYYRAVEGLTQEGKDFKMEYGTAFHKALRLRYDGGDLQAQCKVALDHYMSVDCGEDWRSSAHLLNCITQYDIAYKADMVQPLTLPDGTRALEITFSIPFYRNKWIEVLLCGTIDMIGRYLGQVVIVDHKTTSLSQADSYLASYRTSPQLMVYELACGIILPNVVQGSVINGIFLSKTNKNTFKRSEVISFSDSQKRRFEIGLRGRIALIADNLAKHIDNSATQESLDELLNCNYTCCEETLGQCSFVGLCACDSEADATSLKSLNFVNRIYDPLTFQA